MNKLITDIKALQEQTLNNLKSSKAYNTIRAYKSDFKDFSAFCVKNGFKSFPADSKIVSFYITYLSSKDAKISTLRRRLASIGMIHRLKGYLGIAGIENKNYSGHSLRSGFATVSAESGADERSIMAMTGHKTTQMVRRYIKEANLFKNNALNKIKI